MTGVTVLAMMGCWLLFNSGKKRVGAKMPGRQNAQGKSGCKLLSVLGKVLFAGWCCTG